MRAYSINRPIDLFTYPKQYDYAERVNFPRRRYVEEIGREAWGYIDYIEDVPADELKRYEMVTAEMCAKPTLPPVRVMCKLAQAIVDEDECRVDKMLDQLEARGYDMEAVDAELATTVRELREASWV